MEGRDERLVRPERRFDVGVDLELEKILGMLVIKGPGSSTRPSPSSSVPRRMGGSRLSLPWSKRSQRVEFLVVGVKCLLVQFRVLQGCRDPEPRFRKI